jgi:RNA polymerase subunit RPABC4/transcription elongation factor Spt4
MTKRCECDIIRADKVKEQYLMPSIQLPAELGMIVQVALFFIGAYVLAFWLSLVVWTFVDIRSRSRDILAALLSVLLVLVFNVPGLVIYMVLRPKETLTDAYQRALEEEALLQDIEDQFVCPGCKQKIEGDFLICPNCHTQLKERCPNCNHMLNLKWNICPYCGQ